ncbi:MAG: DUF3120 domain-containing protein, partial [Okeania sp. SIO2D1]|nr:DUF3120 domain-containing protein [Okeania sp. SIO2D1]
LVHLPVEALCLPLALWCLWRGLFPIGSLFYLGSLFGTAITDLYFYIVDLIPHWRKLMEVDPSLATPIFQDAIARIQTTWGLSWAVTLVSVLLGFGLYSIQSQKLYWQAFGGAVLSTILVDSLFWVAASIT